MSAQQKEKDVPIRIKPSVKEMLDDAKVISRESYSDCIKRVLIEYQNYKGD
jgi:uncharacterized protein (DUF1778 family)